MEYNTDISEKRRQYNAHDAQERSKRLYRYLVPYGIRYTDGGVRMRILAALLMLIAATATNASSQSYESAIVFDMGYVASPGWALWSEFPAVGDPLWIVGTVQSLGAPINDLLPPAGAYEATYVIEGLGWVGDSYWDGPGGIGGMSSCFEGGFLRIYVDQTPDANPVDASTYRDGELVLEASLQWQFCLSTSNVAYLCPYTGPTQIGSFIFCGGSWFSHVRDGNGQGYRAYNEGCFSESISETLRQMGYVGQSQGVIDIQGPISTEEATWGKIKALYR
jgi:hypothetical protein